MVKISVIMPVYNVEKYLRDALGSLLNQTMIDDMEVIMINDGSTDDSPYIMEEYAERYDNFHAYHKKNEGPGIARNKGLDLARGEYVHFLDADDYLPPKAYEILYNFNPEADFIVGNILKFGEYNIWENVLFKQAYKSFNHDVKSFNYRDNPNVLWDTISCNKLYKKSFIDKHNLRFISKNVYYEDILFSFQAYLLADRIGFSRNIFYYWRSRQNKTSITQKQDDVKNFKSRIVVLKVYNHLMEKYGLEDDYKNIIYDKWLKHDLRTSIQKMRNYPGKYYSDMIEAAYGILDIIPDDLKDDLNSYLKVLYRMVENRDIESILTFAHLENEIKHDPKMPLAIDGEYLEMMDISCSGENREFEARVSDVFNDKKNLFISFDANLDFIAKDCPHQTKVYLVYNDNLYPLKANNRMFIMSLDLIQGLTHLKFRIDYITDSYTKSTLLKNYSRKSIKYADFDIDLDIGINNILYLDVNRKSDNEIIINEIGLEDDKFIFECVSSGEVGSVFLTNFVTYKQMHYPVASRQGTDEFTFTVPFDDLNKSVVKKWELNSHDSLNSIKLEGKVKFTYGDYRVTFKNKRNKIFIAVNVIPSEKKINRLIKKNQKLINKNSKLTRQNKKLKDTINEFKSRKAVRLVDNISNRFR